MSDDPQRDWQGDSPTVGAPLKPPPLPVAVVPLAPPPLPPLRPSRRKWWIGIGALLVLAIVGGVGVAVWSYSRHQAAVQNLRQVRGPSGSGPGSGGIASAVSPDVAPPDRVAIEAAFVRLGAAVRSGDSRGAAAVLDTDRMTIEMEGLPGVPRFTRRSRSEFSRGLGIGFGSSLASDLKLIGWARHRMGSVKRIGSDDAMAYIRHYSDDGTPCDVRWWWHKSAGGWRAYDYEQLFWGNRLTRGVSLALCQNGNAVPPPWLKHLDTLQNAMDAIAQDDPDAADKALAAMEGQSLPAEIEAARLFAKGRAQFLRKDYQGAVASYAASAALRPDSPETDSSRAAAHNWLDEHAEALKYAKRVEAAVGTDSNLMMIEGYSLEGLGRLDEACAAYRAALDDDPDAAGHLAALARAATTKSGQADVAERFKRSSRSLALFDNVVGNMERHGDDAYDEAALATVISAFRERLGGAGAGSADTGPAALADAIEAGLHARAGRHDRAAAMARESLLLGFPDTGAIKELGDDAPVNLRDRLRRQYLESMYALKKSIEAYRTAQDRGGAFKSLAGMHNGDGDAEGLLRLAAARRSDAPGDPWAHIYEGHAHTTLKAFDKAEVAYAAAAEKVKAASKDDFDENARVLLRYVQLRSRYNLGRSDSALVDLPPAWDAFRQLASLHAEDDDAEGLAKLIAAYRAKRPSDPSIMRWDAELKWLGKDYAAAADLYLAFRKRRDAETPPESESESEPEPPRVGLPGPTPEPDPSYVEDRLIDSLLRSGRGAEAVAIAERSAREHAAHYDLLWVHAFLGNVPEATAAFKAMAEQQGEPPVHLYDYEELGPLLRGEKFAALRAAYPPPPATTQPAQE